MTSARIHLPQYLNVKSARKVLQFCGEIMDSVDAVVHLDASRLVFADPWGMTVLRTCIQDELDYGNQVCVHGLNQDAGSYLSRMDAFAGVDFVDRAPPIHRRHDRSDSLVELTRLTSPHEVDTAAHKLASALVGRCVTSESDALRDTFSGVSLVDRWLKPIDYVLRELLENALTHARRHSCSKASVWVAGQFFPSNGMVRLGITDNGCGFLKSLCGHSALSVETDHAAILAALQPRVSCNRDVGLLDDSVNQGVGLTTSVRIAGKAKGKAVIISGDAIHDTEGRGAVGHLSPPWKGVSISLELQRDALVDVNIPELLPQTDSSTTVHLRFE